MGPACDRQQVPVFACCCLCGGEIYVGQSYYALEGKYVCPLCLTEYARLYFLPALRTAMPQRSLP